MRVRTALILTAIISSMLGAVVAYLVLTVPNDLKADSLMKTAKKEIAAGENDRARVTLSRVVQQYPRTDAAAAATVALVSLADNERHKLVTEIEAIRRDVAGQQKQIVALGRRIDEIAARPLPQPVIIQAPAKKARAKKSTRRTTSHRRRR
jgi:hypothetical protein